MGLYDGLHSPALGKLNSVNLLSVKNQNLNLSPLTSANATAVWGLFPGHLFYILRGKYSRFFKRYTQEIGSFFRVFLHTAHFHHAAPGLVQTQLGPSLCQC